MEEEEKEEKGEEEEVRIEGLWEGEKRRNIKYARTDAWSHSSLPFLPVSLSFQYLFPLNVSLPVFLLSQSPPPSRSLYLATSALGVLSFLS